jgi:copper chaperone
MGLDLPTRQGVSLDISIREFAMPAEKSLTFTVPDMTCGHCVKTITGAVLAAYPNAKVEIDLGTKHVTVENAGDRAAVASVIEAEGYSPADA